MSRRAALVVIARAPERGRVKTRLAAAIGDDAALAAYRALLAITARAVVAWPGPAALLGAGSWEERPAEASGALTPRAATDDALAALPRRAQPEAPLGSRIAAALRWGLELAPRAIAIGADCPALRVGHLLDLDRLLADAPVAFGPADDGGYWAVGVADTAAIPPLCDDGLPWSTPGLLAASRAALDAIGIRHALGARLADCDDAEDLGAAVRAGLLARPAGVRA